MASWQFEFTHWPWKVAEEILAEKQSIHLISRFKMSEPNHSQKSHKYKPLAQRRDILAKKDECQTQKKHLVSTAVVIETCCVLRTNTA